MAKRVMMAVLAIVILCAATACSGNPRVRTRPENPVVKPVAVTYTSPAALRDGDVVVPSCFDPFWLRGATKEWFHNVSDFPVHGWIVDRGDRTVCQFFLKARDRSMGPALWEQDTADMTGQWRVTGQYIYSATDDRRAVGSTERKTWHLRYQPGYGWYLSFFAFEGR